MIHKKYVTRVSENDRPEKRGGDETRQVKDAPGANHTSNMVLDTCPICRKKGPLTQLRYALAFRPVLRSPPSLGLMHRGGQQKGGGAGGDLKEVPPPIP